MTRAEFQFISPMVTLPHSASAAPEMTTNAIAATAATIPKRLPEWFIACSFSTLFLEPICAYVR